MAKGTIPQINDAQRALLMSAQKTALKPKQLKRVQAVLARSDGLKVAQVVLSQLALRWRKKFAG